MPRFRLQTVFMAVLLFAACLTGWDSYRTRLREREALAEAERQKAYGASAWHALSEKNQQIGDLFDLARQHGYWEDARSVMEKYEVRQH